MEATAGVWALPCSCTFLRPEMEHAVEEVTAGAAQAADRGKGLRRIRQLPGQLDVSRTERGMPLASMSTESLGERDNV